MQQASDVEEVEKLLGRKPQGAFEIVVRKGDGGARVIRNAPFLDDGTPMPTLFWLVDPTDRRLVSRLESTGAIKEVEEMFGLQVLAQVHEEYSKERDHFIPTNYHGPKPTGGVGGTRRGIKCLHAHFAWFLAGGEDPVGEWVAERIYSGSKSCLQNLE
jgi:hypothetical protein